MSEQLTIRPYARLLTMLGDQLIKNEQIAVTELMKNSYDADADWVKVSFENFGKDYKIQDDSRIVIEDNGRGMTHDVITNAWMNPATPNKFTKDVNEAAKLVEVSGKKYITDVWPNLEVFFHGGVAFAPYRDAYKEIIPSDSMHYMETYNASEGFFGLQTNPNDPAMELMTHLGVFFEFLPLENMNSNTIDPIPLWEVETDRNYALVISTSTGLWRYEIGDTIRFVSTKPYKFVITGRTKSFINAFGEELIVDNAEQGLKEACQLTGAEISEYTAAPIFMDKNAKCRHQWLIEFSQMPDSIEHFAEVLDESLQKINSDYEAKRAKNITLQPLEIIVAKPGLFNTWLKSEGKLGGQHKVPRLCNDRRIIEKVLAFNN